MAEGEETGVFPSSGRYSSGSEPGSSPQYLSVDETKRPRANSDPVGLHICISTVPEITVTGEDGWDSGHLEDEDGDCYLIPPSPRRRANTCPEDMFRTRKGRPPTPPPTDIQILKNPAGKRFSFNFAAKDLNGVSFAHHKLSKVSEEKADQQQRDVSTKMRRMKGRTELSSCLPITRALDGDGCGAVKDANESIHTEVVSSRLQNNHSEEASLLKANEPDCDQTLSLMKTMTVCDTSCSEVINKREASHSENSTDMISSSPDTCRSKARDNIDNSSLTAY